jgi:8-oxo-dGTP diphosphatase
MSVNLMIEYVCGFLVTAPADGAWDPMGGGRVLLIRKARPEWQRGKLNGVGGKVEPGETPMAAMIREFTEEAGWETDGWVERVVLQKSDWRVRFMIKCIAAGSRVELRGKPDEPLSWHDLPLCLPDAIPNLQWVVPLCLDDSIEGPVFVTHR